MANSAGKHRRKFTPEYRREAAHLVIDTGRTIVEVADEINVGAQLLGRWVAQERESIPPQSVVSESERAELERLRVENRQLKMDVAFLGKAAAFFASRSGSGTASL
jgi:transposase